MGLIEYYLIFALTTSLFALIDIFYPTLKRAQAEGVDNTLTQNPKLSYFVYVCITTIIAPLVFLPLIIPSLNQRFREGIEKTVYAADE
jgi:uncharacterized membrane protein YdjX (TVP38/TMEM64 family)